MSATPAEPVFSLVVPIHRTDPQHLQELLASVQAQTRDDWELLLVDDGSDDTALTDALDAAATADPRVRVERMPANQGIAAATQRGIELARGEFIGLVDHDDVLDPDALTQVGSVIGARPDADVFYTDEDQLHDARLTTTFRKPDWSPERLLGQMYLGHLVVYRRGLLEQIGGLRPGTDGSQDYDLALRATRAARGVAHVPYVAYHWRIHDRSVSHGTDTAPVFAAARAALERQLALEPVATEVEQVHPVGVYRVHRRPDPLPPVSILLPTRGSRGQVHDAHRVMVTHAVRSVVETSTYPSYEIVVLADEDTPSDVLDELAEIGGDRLRVVTVRGPFSFSGKMNRGAVEARHDLLLMLNDDVEVVSPDWIEAMVSASTPRDVGVVGARLLHADGTVQHAGLVFESGDVWHVAAGAPGWWPGPCADLLVDREVSGVTAACLLVKRAVFEEVGGMSAALPVSFNDVDLSLKVTAAGYRIICTPHATLYHFESQTRRRYVTASEVTTFRSRWQHRLQEDPYWHHHPDDVARGIAEAVGAPVTSAADR